VYDVDPKSAVLQVPGPAGRHHAFRVTRTIEDDCEVFREQPQINSRSRAANEPSRLAVATIVNGQEPVAEPGQLEATTLLKRASEE
jgi:hypothetical protein